MYSVLAEDYRSLSWGNPLKATLQALPEPPHWGPEKDCVTLANSQAATGNYIDLQQLQVVFVASQTKNHQLQDDKNKRKEKANLF